MKSFEIPQTLEGLEKMLKLHTLDPRFLKYGSYIQEYNVEEWHPERPKKLHDEVVAKKAKGIRRISANFYDVSWAFTLDIPKDDVKKWMDIINEHMDSDKFRVALKDTFNSVHIVKTTYSDRVLGWGGRWYKHEKVSDNFSLDSNRETLEEMMHEMDAKQKKKRLMKGETAVKFSLSYDEILFLTSEEEREFNETIREEMVIKNKHLPHVRRHHRELKNKNLVTRKFKCTGREFTCVITGSMCAMREIGDPFKKADHEKVS